MKKLVILALLLINVLSLYSQDTTKSKQILNFDTYNKLQNEKLFNIKFPDFVAKTSDSTILSNKYIKNKIVFINFWFSTCTPCMAEMHGLNRMFEKLKDKKDFEFISFTYEPESVIKEIILKYNIKYKVIHIDKTECYRLNFNNGYPTSLILDKDCRIKFIKVGGAINEDGDDIAGAQVMEILLPKILDQL